MTKSSEEPLRVVDRRWWARAEQNPDAPAGESEPIERKPTAVEDLERQVAEKTAQLQGVLTEHRRALDEFEQIKTRMRREVARDVERGRRAVIADLLDVLDNLDRAIAAARETPSSSDTLLRGVELVRDQFLAKLEALGVSRVDAVGQPFDATVHDAVSMAPVAEAAQDGVVIAVAKEGYAIGDELLRPATVVVGRFDG
jgi:molecular chaperone GrpE